jgi:hypothetical protein
MILTSHFSFLFVRLDFAGFSTLFNRIFFPDHVENAWMVNEKIRYNTIGATRSQSGPLPNFPHVNRANKFCPVATCCS